MKLNKLFNIFLSFFISFNSCIISVQWENLYPSCLFSLNNSEIEKAVNRAFCRIKLLFIGNNQATLVSLTCSSLQISDKNQTREFPISSFPVKLIINRSCRKSTTSDDTDMKLGPVTKIDKRNTATSKELTVTSCRQIMTPASLFLIHG